METLHKILQESISGSFWQFAGYYLILSLIANLCYQLLYSIGKAILFIIKHYITKNCHTKPVEVQTINKLKK